jgi:predicted esterase
MHALVAIAAFLAVLLAGPTLTNAQVTRLAVLMPGAGGAVPIDFLVRNEGRIRAAGIETAVTTSPDQAASLVQAAIGNGRKVVLIGMSRGARDVAQALRSGARPSGVILVSGALGPAMQILGSPAALPATLLVHHRRDECPRTSPAIAQRFAAWSGGKARLHWIDNTGHAVPNPCGPRGAHGFFIKDGAAVAAIVAFIQSR